MLSHLDLGPLQLFVEEGEVNMMRAMRATARPVILVVAVAFFGWMVFEVGMDITGQGGVTIGDPAVEVNGEEINLQTYYDAVRNMQEQRRQQGLPFGYTLEEQRALEDAVLDNMIQTVLLRQEFDRRGIRVTDEEIIATAEMSPPPEIMQEPTFQTDGRFDPAKYRRYLQLNPDPNFLLQLEARYRDEIPQAKLFEQLAAAVYLPTSKLWRMYQDQNDSVTLRLVELIPELVAADSEVTITDEEISRYYREHRRELEQPATAYLSYLVVSRRANAQDTTLAWEWANELRQEILDGTPFEDVARRESADSASRFEGGDLGMVARDRFVTEFVDAAVALRDGEISEPVQSQFGIHIIRRESAPRDSIHASHILVPFDLYGDHLLEVESRADTLDLLAAEQEDGGALDEVAELLGLTVSSAPPLRSGERMFLGGEGVPDVGLWAFETFEGETSQVIETPNNYYVFRLDEFREEGIPPLELVEDEVRRAIQRDFYWERTRQLAEEMATNIRNGQNLAEAALENLLGMNTYGPMTRISPAPELRTVPEVVGAAFGLGVGQTSGPIETENSIFLVQTVEKQLADSALFATQSELLRLQLENRIKQERVQRFVISLRDVAEIHDFRRELERIQREYERNPPALPGAANPLGMGN